MRVATPSGPSGPATMAISTIEAANEAATSHWAIRWDSARGCDRAECPFHGLAIAPLPVHAASRNSTVVAIAPPDGTALSCGSLGQVISRS